LASSRRIIGEPKAGAARNNALSTSERSELFDRLRTRSTDADLDMRTTLPDLATAVTTAPRPVRTVEQAERPGPSLSSTVTSRRRADEQVAQTLGRLLDRGHFRQWIVDEALGDSSTARQCSASSRPAELAGRHTTRSARRRPRQRRRTRSIAA
jgi:hypothetical protein